MASVRVILGHKRAQTALIRRTNILSSSIFIVLYIVAEKENPLSEYQFIVKGSKLSSMLAIPYQFTVNLVV
jgi:hypothetical protein